MGNRFGGFGGFGGGGNMQAMMKQAQKMQQDALKAKEELDCAGILTNVYSVPTIKPINEDSINRIAQNTKLMITMEEQ